MTTTKGFVSTTVPAFLVGAATWALAQQGIPAQPRPAQPAQPAHQTPSQSPQTAPQPGQPGGPQVAPQPGQPGGPQTAQPGNINRMNTRPFTFSSPEAEARFGEASRRLTTMEQHWDQSNQDLMKRLGQARTLTGERQSAATYDIMQQMIRDNADLHRYLIQSRQAWMGEDAPGVQTAPENTLPIQTQPIPTSPTQPGTQPPPSR